MNNNPETYLLSHNRFIDYLVLIFATISNIIKYGFEYRNNKVNGKKLFFNILNGYN